MDNSHFSDAIQGLKEQINDQFHQQLDFSQLLLQTREKFDTLLKEMQTSLQ